MDKEKEIFIVQEELCILNIMVVLPINFMNTLEIQVKSHISLSLSFAGRFYFLLLLPSAQVILSFNSVFHWFPFVCPFTTPVHNRLNSPGFSLLLLNFPVDSIKLYDATYTHTQTNTHTYNVAHKDFINAHFYS